MYPSRHGLHLNPKFYCTEYSATRCCITCTVLERHKYRVINGVYKVTTASLPATTELFNYGVFNDIYKATTTSIPAISAETRYKNFNIVYKESKSAVQPSVESNDYKVSNNFHTVTTTEIPVAVESFNYKVKNDVYKTTTTDIPSHTADNLTNGVYEATRKKTAVITFFTVPYSLFKKQMSTTDKPLTTPTIPLLHGLDSGAVHSQDFPLSTTKTRLLSNITRTVQPRPNTGQTVEQFFTIPPNVSRTNKTKSAAVSAKHSATTYVINEHIPYENIPSVEPAPLLVNLNMSSPHETIAGEAAAAVATKTITNTTVLPGTYKPTTTQTQTIAAQAAAEIATKSTTNHETIATEAAASVTTKPITNTTVSPGTYKQTTTTPQTQTTKEICIDVGIWVVNTSVPCDYLVTDNKYGLNKNQLFFCNRYPLTSCCETCEGINRGSVLSYPILTVIREVQKPTTAEKPLSAIDIRTTGEDKVTKERIVITTSSAVQDSLTKNQFQTTETPVSGTQTTQLPYNDYMLKQSKHIQTEPTLTAQIHILPNLTQEIHPRQKTYQSVGTFATIHPDKTPAENANTHLVTEQIANNNSASMEPELSAEAYKLVSTTGKTTPMPPDTSQPSTTKPTMKQTTTRQKGVVRRRCVDIGIWIGSRSVPCDYLVKDNIHRINEDPLYFCNRYPLTSCCNTCAMINSILSQ
ncbi:uncharacterized protein LOC123563617 isoform X2 [Mercenaria mercenaria]|nr:uncharacterized protein LOC123563617 isoform X2 [Mercenaria mercenaria]